MSGPLTPRGVGLCGLMCHLPTPTPDPHKGEEESAASIEP
jgi:hypothetical protein